MDSHEPWHKNIGPTPYARLLTDREWEFNGDGMIAPKKPTPNDNARAKTKKKSKKNMNPGMGLRRVPLPPHD